MPKSLDLNDLIKGKKVDDATAKAEAARLLKATAGGVDLSELPPPPIHEHRWTMSAVFDMAASRVDAIGERRAAVVKAIAEGADPEVVDKIAKKSVPLPLEAENILRTDGPGCLKCGSHWEAPSGWGQGCPVSDLDFDATWAAGREQLEGMLAGRLNQLVEEYQAQAEVQDEAEIVNGPATDGAS